MLTCYSSDRHSTASDEEKKEHEKKFKEVRRTHMARQV